MNTKLPYSVSFVYFEGTENIFDVFYATFPPLGMAYVAAVLQNNVDKVEIIDAPAMRYSMSDILEQISQKKPDFVGMSVFTPQVNAVIKLCEGIKKVSPATKIFLGGPHVFFLHKQIIKDYTAVDYCIRGEGEFTTLELLRAIYNSTDLKEIKGLTYRNGDEIIVNPERELIENLDKIPFPARNLLPNDKYRALQCMGGLGHFTSMIVSRGCPFNCTYCDSGARWKRKVRFRSVDNVIEEMVVISEKYNVKYVNFGDDIFTLNPKWVREFCEKYHRNKLSIQWSCDARVDKVNLEMLKTMKKAGCTTILFGIEFGNDDIRKLVGKKFSKDKIYEAVNITQKAGISPYGLFMVGYPGETRSTIEETINLALNLDLDWAGCSIVQPLPGTALYDYCKKKKLLKTYDWKDYTTKSTPVFRNDKLTDEEILKAYESLQLRFYLRPKYIIKRIFNLKSINDFRFAFRFVVENIKGQIISKRKIALKQKAGA